VAAQSVGDDEKPVGYPEVVFVVPTDPADVARSVGPYWRVRRGARLMGRTGVERRGGWVALG